MTNWYEGKNGAPKGHRNPHSCKYCRENPKGACPLPFRKSRRVRWLKKMETKPAFFLGLWFRKFMEG